jgi:hypothetical protein
LIPAETARTKNVLELPVVAAPRSNGNGHVHEPVTTSSEEPLPGIEVQQ